MQKTSLACFEGQAQDSSFFLLLCIILAEEKRQTDCCPLLNLVKPQEYSRLGDGILDGKRGQDSPHRKRHTSQINHG